MYINIKKYINDIYMSFSSDFTKTRAIKQPNISTLETVLQCGNTTSGKDIILSTGDEIIGQNNIILRPSSSSEVSIYSDVNLIGDHIYKVNGLPINKTSMGITGTVQYSDGEGGFLGDTGLMYNPHDPSDNTLMLRGNFVPAENITYSLGSTGLAWKDLYLSKNGIYFMDYTNNEISATISVDVSNNIIATTYDPSGNILTTGSLGPAAMNYVQILGIGVNDVSGSNETIISGSITSNGFPVQLIVTGDIDTIISGVAQLQLYRGSTPIGQIVSVDVSGNCPYALNFIDERRIHLMRQRLLCSNWQAQKGYKVLQAHPLLVRLARQVARVVLACEEPRGTLAILASKAIQV